MILCLVRDPGGFELPDHLDHPADVTVLGGRWIMEGRLDSEGGEVLEERLLIDLGEVRQAAAGFARVADGLVVNVC